MINNLIIPPKSKYKKKIKSDDTEIVRRCAFLYLNGMGEVQLKKMKMSLKIGNLNLDSVAKRYGVNANDFKNEIKKLL